MERKPQRAGFRCGAFAAVGLALALASGETASAQQNSNHDFSVDETILNQCTGEPTTVSLQGKIVSRGKPAGDGYAYSVLSQLNGSATGDASGTEYRFVGTENAEFESDTIAAELVLWANVRVLTRGGEAAYIGYDVQTISIGDDGEIEHVDHRFDFACD